MSTYKVIFSNNHLVLPIPLEAIRALGRYTLAKTKTILQIKFKIEADPEVAKTFC